MLKEYYNKYFGKRVKVEITDGRTLIGKFYTIERPGDNDYEEWSIGILVRKECIEEVLESEIKSMESAELSVEIERIQINDSNI